MKYTVKTCDILSVPFGISGRGKKYYIKAARDSKQLFLVLYKRNSIDFFEKIEFPKDNRLGNIFAMQIIFDELPKEQIEYAYFDGEGYFEDEYGAVFSGRDTFGKEISDKTKSLRTDFFAKSNLKNIEIKDIERKNICDNIFYRVNVRSFTKSKTSKCIHKGTFGAVSDKFEHIKSLGVNALLFMPVYEFDEFIDENRKNVWGYSKADMFAPKASYCSKKNRNVTEEFALLIDEAHKNNLEVFLEFYFDKRSSSFISDVLRFWAYYYKIDGFLLSGFYDIKSVLDDEYLKDVKFLVNNSDTASDKRVGIYGESFKNEMRAFIKGDEDMLKKAASNILGTRGNVLTFMADIQGFSLYDLFCFDMKHNEDNLEDNRDGTDYNFSWNCGEEGYTRKRKINELREKQFRNAVIFSYLSRGIPLIAQGDEFGDMRGGNNNSYCGDSEKYYIDWKLLDKNKNLYNWVKLILGFRKRYSFFNMNMKLTGFDTLSCGMPDYSIHGLEPWHNNFEVYSRELGILYCGLYDKEIKNKDVCENVYIIYNMHWIKHNFKLPKQAHGYKWHLFADTSDADLCNSKNDYEANLLDNQKEYELDARSIAILIAKA